MKISELLQEEDLLEGFEDEVIALYTTLLEDEGGGEGGFDTSGPPVVPMGPQPTPPNGYGGGWVRGGPFRPFSGGGKWFGELYGSVKRLAVAKKIKDRLKQLGIKGIGVDRIDGAYKSALFNVRDLIKNPQKTAYHFPKWTTKVPKMPKIPVWREALAIEFAKELSKMKLNEIITDKGKGPAWEVEYEVYGSNKEKPLYKKTRTIYAATEEDAKAYTMKYLSRNILNIKKKD